MEPLHLSADRLFDVNADVRKLARTLYESVATLPLVCPHGHVPPELLALDEPFGEPTSLIITPDHYILRMLHSQGIPLERLGVPTRDETAFEKDPRKIWRLFADHYHLFLGTPTRVWLDHVLHEVFDVRIRLTSESAMEIYDAVSARLSEPEFRPRALFDRFNIEVLTTTDGAADTLEHHDAIARSSWNGRVIPCFRPDALFKLASADWRSDLDRLSLSVGREIDSYNGFIQALEERRAFFRSRGATATDHGVESPRTERLIEAEASRTFDRALAGEASEGDQAVFQAHMLMEMARMSTEDGMVMQLHAGSLRNHDLALHDRFGPDRGADIPLATEFTRNLRELLCAYGSHPGFTLVVFTLDESTYARELAPLAGHYPALRLGPAWWFFDSVEGMRRYRRLTTETAGIWNTAGFNDDTRAFLSIPARHDVARRVDANWLAGLVAEHRIGEEDAHRMMRAITYDLVRETYRLA